MLVQIGTLLFGANVRHQNQGWADHFARGIEEDSSVHLAGESDAGNLGSGAEVGCGDGFATARLVHATSPQGVVLPIRSAEKRRVRVSSVADATMRPSSPDDKARVPPVPHQCAEDIAPWSVAPKLGRRVRDGSMQGRWLVNVFIRVERPRGNHSAAPEKRMIPFLWPLVL